MTKSKIKKPKFKAEYGTAKWEAAANEVARCYAPEIYPKAIVVDIVVPMILLTLILNKEITWLAKQ